jgi:hypothetical protein
MDVGIAVISNTTTFNSAQTRGLDAKNATLLGTTQHRASVRRESRKRSVATRKIGTRKIHETSPWLTIGKGIGRDLAQLMSGESHEDIKNTKLPLPEHRNGRGQRIAQYEMARSSMTPIWRHTSWSLAPRHPKLPGHPTLPIRSIDDPGTAREQAERWISDDPSRCYWAKEQETKWRDYFYKADQNPAGPRTFRAEGQEQVDWWENFLFDGSRTYGPSPL